MPGLYGAAKSGTKIRSFIDIVKYWLLNYLSKNVYYKNVMN